MPLSSSQQAALSAALDRLQNFYDGDHAYNPATYPGAFRQFGSVVNFVPALKDVATVMQLASVLVADATAAAASSPKALRVDSAQSFLPSERGTGRGNLKLPGSAYVYQGANISLTKDDVGTTFYTDSTITITLPLLSDCVNGDTFEFFVNAGTLTLAQPAGNSNPIGTPGGSGQTIPLTAGSYRVRSHGSAWRILAPPIQAVDLTIALLSDRVQAFNDTQRARLLSNLGYALRADAPQSFTAAQLQQLLSNLGSSAGGLVPPGAWSFFAMTTPPAGWLKANGGSYPRASYPALFNAIGTSFGSADANSFYVPDIRGYFPRALDDGRGVDASRVMGSIQGSQNLSHGHGSVGSFLASGGGTYWVPYDASQGYLPMQNVSQAIAASGGSEARPSNMAFPVFIKY